MKEDPQSALLYGKCYGESNADGGHQPAQSIKAGDAVKGDAPLDEYQGDNHGYEGQEVQQDVHLRQITTLKEDGVSDQHNREYTRHANKIG